MVVYIHEQEFDLNPPVFKLPFFHVIKLLSSFGFILTLSFLSVSFHFWTLKPS